MNNKINQKIFKVFNHIYNHLVDNGYKVDMESLDNGKMIINVNKEKSVSVICVYTIGSDDFVYVSVTTMSIDNKEEFKLVITIDTIRNKILVYYNDKAYVLDYNDRNIFTLVQDIVEKRK